MKNFILGIALSVTILVIAGASTQTKNGTSDYQSVATVHVVEKATRLIIRTTIEGEESQAINVNSGYVDVEDMVNFKPVLDELARLRVLGYELQSSSLSTISYGKKSASRPYHAFILVK